MAFQRPKNDPLSSYYNSGWRNHPNFLWNSGSNAMVPNSQPRMFPVNNSQPISHLSNSFQRLTFLGIPNAPPPPLPPPTAQVQPPLGYTDTDKLERRINNNVERMINTNMERMMRMMTEQFFHLASSSRERGTFLSQPKVNPKGHASPSTGNPNEPMRKVNAVISLHSGREVDNQVRNHNEPCECPCINSSRILLPLLLQRLVHPVSRGMLLMVLSMLQIVFLHLSHLLREISFKRKTPLTWQVLHLLGILPPLLLLRKSRCLCLLFPIG